MVKDMKKVMVVFGTKQWIKSKKTLRMPLIKEVFGKIKYKSS